MTEDAVLDITIRPPATAGEVDMLVFALDRSRATFAWKCGGLDAAGLRKPHPPSAMTLGGLLKHLALVEDRYTAEDFTGQPIGPPWDAVDFEADPEWEWRTAADDSPEELYALWRGAVERSRAAMARALAQAGSTSRRGSPPGPASRPASGASWSTCTTSTPATSAMRTCCARPSTVWWVKTRRSDDTRMMSGMNPIAEEDLRIVPANQASWDELQDIFGTTDYPSRCQRFKVIGWIWRDSTPEERTAMLQAQTACGDPDGR